MHTADRLVRDRHDAWEELEYLLDRSAGRRIRRLASRDIERLGTLYRRVISDLAVARRDFPTDPVTDYLESLASRAHPGVFRGRATGWGDVAAFFGLEFPRTVRKLTREMTVSGLVFFGSLLVSMGWALSNPKQAEGFLPSIAMERIEDVGTAVRESGSSPWVEIPPLERPLESYRLAMNNIRVTLLAFVGGAVLGLLTLHMLAVNGIYLGLITAFCIREDAIIPLGTFVAAHGFVELSVVVLAGGAGLAVGRAWLQPGDGPRLVAVTRAARQAVTVALGGAGWLLVAGLLEGLVSPSNLMPWVKLLVGVVAGTAMWTFLVMTGRDRRGQSSPRPLIAR